MNLRSGHRSTSARTGRGLGEDQGENGRGDDNGSAHIFLTLFLDLMALYF